MGRKIKIKRPKRVTTFERTMATKALSEILEETRMLREMEEREISALASHADTVNTYRIEMRPDKDAPWFATVYWREDGQRGDWRTLPKSATIFNETERFFLALPPGGVWMLLQTSTLECHGCGKIETLDRSAREAAEKAYAEGWMVYQGHVLCGNCQQQ